MCILYAHYAVFFFLIIFLSLPIKKKIEGDYKFLHYFINFIGDIEVLILDYVLLQPKEMVSFLLLLNQIICKFHTLFRDILEEVFPAIAGRIFNVIPRDAFPSGPGTNTEVWEDQFIELFFGACSLCDECLSNLCS